MPNIRWLLALITAVHRFVYRASGGRLGRRLGGVETLLLETVGRRTGRRRTTPLLFVRDDARFVVVASNAGDARHPAWWLNLRAHPEATIQVGRERLAVRGREATELETQRLWDRLEAEWPDYAAYRRRTDRRIPVVILEPRDGEDAARSG
ncbi:MAG: nitroreductase/quinone reductase family protein [Myxococcota bacterium]|nr:nitroreductase/quinone reductase family protein [Myxococcota bacterium]